MSDIVRYFFDKNGSTDKWNGLFRVTGYEAPPGGCVRPAGKGDEHAIQIPEKEADLLIACLPDRFRPFFVKETNEKELSKSSLIPLPPPQDSISVQHAPDKDYPSDDVEKLDMSWSKPQIRAWMRDTDEDLLKKLRGTSSVEAHVLAVWKKYLPEKAKTYIEATKI
jgi:hypothetical protein